MRYIIFSDLHSNLESLRAFEKEIASIPHDKIACLGDTVGYGADPNPCLDWVRKNADIVLGGNHDYAAVKRTDTEYFNPWAYQSCLWTRKELSKVNTKFLKSLPCELEADGIHWVHSSPFEPEEWHYVTSRRDGAHHFDHFTAPLCFLGHSHQPVILDKPPEGRVEDYVSDLWDLEDGHRYIINVGSLGQPRDHNPDPCFVVLDQKAKTVAFHRYSYDIESAQKKILENSLPAPLAERLQEGW